jgi:AcrR family transcriptional regulator
VSAGRFVQETRSRLREGILDATEQIVLDGGWSAVTMAAVAARVGVSRQTVYNDVGGKDALGEALVLRELEGFLEVVGGELSSGDDLVDAVERTVEAVMTKALDNPLLKDVLVSAHGGETSLLPFLTARSDQLVARATAVLVLVIADRPDAPDVPERDLLRVCETVVRLVLSHVVHPGAAPDAVAADVGWLVRHVLASVTTTP